MGALAFSGVRTESVGILRALGLWLSSKTWPFQRVRITLMRLEGEYVWGALSAIISLPELPEGEEVVVLARTLEECAVLLTMDL